MIKKAVLLIAGYETKLSPYTDEMHQCMFNLGQKTILEDMLEKLQNCGIKQVILIVGHKAALIKSTLKNKFENLEIKYIENKKYLTTGVAYSLLLAKKELEQDFLLIDGDMIVEEDFIKTMIESKEKNLLAVDYAMTHSKKNIVYTKILNGKIKEIGKNIQVQDNQNFSRFLGFSKFDKETGRLLVNELEKFELKDELNKIYEDALNNIIPKITVKAFNSRKYNWFEVDEISEFELAKKIFGDTENLKQKAFDFGANEVYITLPTELIFDDRARLQCLNCKNYDKKCTCPPFVENIDYEKLIKKYKKGLFILVKADCSNDFQKARTDSTNNLHKILLKLEKEAFSQDNHFTTSFLGGSCKMCPQGCAGKEGCRNPNISRTPLEATGVDVVETMKKFGVYLKFPATDYIYRVGLLLIG